MRNDKDRADGRLQLFLETLKDCDASQKESDEEHHALLKEAVSFLLRARMPENLRNDQDENDRLRIKNECKKLELEKMKIEIEFAELYVKKRRLKEEAKAVDEDNV